MSVGPYHPDVTYMRHGRYPGDVVIFGNASWECIKECRGISPPDGKHWRIFARGADQPSP